MFHNLYNFSQLSDDQQGQARQLVDQPQLFLYKVEQGEVTRAYYQAAVVRGQAQLVNVKGR